MSHESISHDKSGTIHILNVFSFKINPLLHRINSKTFFFGQPLYKLESEMFKMEDQKCDI